MHPLSLAKGVGRNRVPVFDKAWRVEDDNSFGTDEFIKFCRKLGCEPYICLNAGTGDLNEMSNWLNTATLIMKANMPNKEFRTAIAIHTR